MTTSATASTRSCSQTAVVADGIQFSSCQATPYLSINYHRSASGTKSEKALWNIARPEECHVFCTAEFHSWQDWLGNHWAVAASGEPDYGTQRERLAYFPKPANSADTWHGYPVDSRRGSKLRHAPPPDDLVRKWHESGRISFVDQQRILRRRR